MMFSYAFIPSPFSGAGFPSLRIFSFILVQHGWFSNDWNASVCVMCPNTRPVVSLNPAIASMEPFGLYGNSCVGSSVCR